MKAYEQFENVRTVRTVRDTAYEMYGVSKTPYIRTPTVREGREEKNSPLVDYRRLAQLHRPTDSAGLARAVHDLLAQGLTPRDAAQALQLPLGWVINVAAARE